MNLNEKNVYGDDYWINLIANLVIDCLETFWINKDNKFLWLFNISIATTFVYIENTSYYWYFQCNPYILHHEYSGCTLQEMHLKVLLVQTVIVRTNLGW